MKKDYISDLLSNYKQYHILKQLQCYDSVILFGTEKDVAQYKDYFEENGIKAVAFCNRDINTCAGEFAGLPVIAPRDLLNYDLKQHPICIANYLKAEIMRILRNLAIDDYYTLIFEYELEPSYNLEETVKLYKEHTDDFRIIYDMLVDDISRETFLGLIQMRCTLRFPTGIWNDSYGCYFHPIVGPQPGDIIIDGGARIGDSAMKFAEHLANNCKIISFEPQQNNYNMMLKNIEDYGLEKVVTAVHAGLWNENGKEYLMRGAEEYSGINYISEQGDIIVDVTTIDTYLEKTQTVPDIIKLDIEGGEMKALHGAVKTITTHKPRLIISIYHKARDLWEIPMFIKNLYPGYVFFISQHDPANTESVLYGLTKEELESRSLL